MKENILKNTSVIIIKYMYTNANVLKMHSKLLFSLHKKTNLN